MPVDKFGHTDSSSVQRVTAGGVTLTQINNSFVRLDGSNAFVPSEDNHITTKKYVDDQDSTKVSKTGDTMTGNLLLLSPSPERTRTMGCKDLRGNKQFVLLLGSTLNKIQCQPNVPITLQTTDGFLCKQGDNDLIRFGKSATDRRTELYENIVMSQKYIVDLHDPSEAQDAATKNYVDKSFKKCRVGYIPNLEANASMTGFNAQASSSSEEHEAYRAFNNLEPANSWFSADSDTSPWLQIVCPEPVIIWRLALTFRMDQRGWNLTGSNDGTTFTALLSSREKLYAYEGPVFFDISTTTAYQYYRLTLAEDEWLHQGIRVMQLYVYDT